jgi:hypothetical protein
VVIDEIAGYRTENEPVMYTRFLVEFNNSLDILISIKKKSSDYYQSLLDQHVGDIHLDDMERLKDLPRVIKGSSEDGLNIILDSDICNSIIKMKKNLAAIEVGRGRFKGFEGKVFPRTLIDIEPDLAVYVDRRSLQEMKQNVVEFRFALDTLVDLVDKTERSVPCIEEARRRKESRRREEAQILLELPATTQRLLDRLKGEAGLTAKEIGDELRATGLTIQNIDIVQALLRLVQEGRASREQGQDREIRYSAK